MFILFLISCAVLLSYGVYKLAIIPMFYWKKRNVPYKTPYPLLGNVELSLLLRKKSFYDNVISTYNHFPNERYNGLFQFTVPTLLVRDLDIIKDITVKQFEHFTDHRNITETPMDPILKDNLVQLSGDKWKMARSTLSPAFTSSKMKHMFTLISQCAENLADFIVSQDENLIEVELKELFTRYTTDVIATCGFGVTCDSFKDKDNEFYKMGAELTTVTGLSMLKGLFFVMFPKLFRLMKIHLLPTKVTEFFTSSIKESIKYRIENNILRPDIIHLLLEARKGKLHHEKYSNENDNNFSAIDENEIKLNSKINDYKSFVDDDFIVAQAFIFFFAGFETSSNLIAFLVTELAINVEVQEKLFEEITKVMEKSNGKPNYNDIAEMKYLDMVVSETLRKWPPAGATDRECTKEYKIQPSKSTESTYTVSVGDNITIPILGLHRDETYFPNPEKFDPERFSDENKMNIVPYSYLPFGIGPRACIGSRFALLEIKIVLVYLLAKCEVTVVKKTSVPLKISPKELKIQPENGFWVGLKKR